VNRGAVSAAAPRAFENEFGSVQQTSLKVFGDVLHTFVSRKGNLFLEGFGNMKSHLVRGHGLSKIDHITCNVEKGKLDEWTSFYEKVFGLKNTRYFDIHTQRTGLYSKVMQSPKGEIKIPFNEPGEGGGQIQEYLDVNHGPGVQHVALLTSNIIDSLTQLKNEEISFLDVPATYYEDVPKRVPQVSEPMATLEKLGILVDGSKAGYLLQIFTQNLIGPFFYEVIQRKGDDGFGEGNFRALFEAIERDQIRRGVLK
jgi:4-hydroxyphenylpyruvate dioxygenase